VNFFKILKDAIGKDITRFCVPVYFNEPLSMLQKMAESLGNQHLLQEAGREPSSIRRMALVAAYCIGTYAGTEHRISKPFNPILGETYELFGDDFRMIAEQVSHHPPISAAYAESSVYKMWLNTSMKSKFKGNSLEITPLGAINIKMGDDHFIITRPTTSGNNIIIGGMYVDTFGTMEIKNVSTGDYLKVRFKSQKGSGFFSKKDAYEVKGKINDEHLVEGKWNEYVKVTIDGREEELWRVAPKIENYE